MSPIMFFIMVTLIMLHNVTQTLAQTGTPTIAPSTRAPGTPTQAPGTPTRAPGSPSFAPTYAPTSTGYCPAY